MSGSVIALESHQRVIYGRPKKKGPMRIEMATASTPNNTTVEEFAEPISIIYGRPNSDRSNYAKTARQEDAHLIAWVARYGAYHLNSLPTLTKATFSITATYLKVLTRKGALPAEQWVVRSRVQP